MKMFTIFIALLNIQWQLPAQGFAPSARVLYRTNSVSVRPGDVYDIEPKRDTRKERKKGLLESLNPLNLFKPKEKPKSEMERLIDNQFEGTGPLGAFIGAGLKGLGRTVEKSMEDAMKEVSDVADEVERALSADGMATSLLGNSIVVGSPFHQMTSSSSINGNVMKTVQLAMPVEGTSQKGIVSVEAISKGSDLSLRSLVLQVNGQQYQVDTERRSAPSGPRGGPSSTNRQGGSSSSGDKPEYVDVEIL